MNRKQQVKKREKPDSYKLVTIPCGQITPGFHMNSTFATAFIYLLYLFKSMNAIGAICCSLFCHDSSSMNTRKSDYCQERCWFQIQMRIWQNINKQCYDYQDIWFSMFILREDFEQIQQFFIPNWLCSLHILPDYSRPSSKGIIS